VQIGDEEYADGKAFGTKVNGRSLDKSLIQTVGSILADYSKVAGSFDHAVRLIVDMQLGQQQQSKLMDSVVQSLSRVEAQHAKLGVNPDVEKSLGDAVRSLSAGLEALTTSISRTVTTELQATRIMMQEMDRSHSSSLRLLSNNHAQSAVQIAAAIERNVSMAEDVSSNVTSKMEARIDDAVREAVEPMGLTVAQQIQRLESAFTQLSKENSAGIADILRERGAPSSSEPGISTKALEGQISAGFDRISESVGSAFSAYSGVLKLAVAALEKSDADVDRVSEHVAGGALRRIDQMAG
jgi:phosphate uptake regulator